MSNVTASTKNVTVSYICIVAMSLQHHAKSTAGSSVEHAHDFTCFVFGYVSYRLMMVPMPASWDGWWQPTVSARCWPRPFLAFGPTTGHAGSHWCVPSSSTCQPISTTPTHTCRVPITSSTCSCPEPLWALEQVNCEGLNMFCIICPHVSL